MIYNSFHKIFVFLIIYFQFNKPIYISSGIKTLNKFLYSTRYNYYYNQNGINVCSLSEGGNCYFTENKYIKSYNNIKTNNKINDEWVFFFNRTQKYDNKDIVDYFFNYNKNYIKKNSKKIDLNQNSQGEIFKYLLTFDNFDEYTIKKDIYYDEKTSEIFFNKEIVLEIEGKLKLSYDKDESELYLTAIDKDYPTSTYGFIQSKYINISFRGKVFICNFFYIKAHDAKSKSEQIIFYGYVKNKVVFSYSYMDNKKRNEKWLKVFFPTITPINKLVISGPYDIDNISFTFLNKKYEDSNVYTIYNHKNIQILVKDEDI